LAFSGPADSEPEVVLLPVQSPAAVHDVAFVEDQVNINDEPAITDDALVVNWRL
jgi:hypothetical protein